MIDDGDEQLKKRERRVSDNAPYRKKTTGGEAEGKGKTTNYQLPTANYQLTNKEKENEETDNVWLGCGCGMRRKRGKLLVGSKCR
jgi:lipopolysaccharide export system protein LptA